MVHDNRLLNHSSYVVKATNLTAMIQLLEKPETPVGTEFCMAYDHKQ